ncbi:adenosylcobinamide-GDP ribazoletransferase [Sphingomonas montanisoli]|uniref:Adenosylcobinamide-GDP ribazoletransferase n=1 Tax=Sphingomonas montanisoli TaxID=2606412 RepID=A0A5D9C3T4_9SPHN|nr:adenosylcobinamide-GDP ribazoletransferase [Sphingomonas montanisoli]TZG25942.1 adenosylcobinamide-GDP ribazoletransferase [Sphingomonas montanisoli]
MKGLIVAIQFLTRLPTPRIAVSDAEFAGSMRWFPAVGLIVGAILAGGAWVGAWIDPWVGALAALLLWIGMTGALHLDGLGDIADASGAAHKDRARMIAVMSDPHVGSFGVVAIALQIAAKLVLLHGAVAEQLWWAIALIPFAARIGPLLWTRMLPPLHAGLAARFAHVIRPVHLAIWAGVLLIACWFAPSLVAAPVAMLAWTSWLRRRIGGISGDGHGAGIELTESTLLLAALIVARMA